MLAEAFDQGHWLRIDLPFPCEIHFCYPQKSVLPGAKKVLSIFSEPKEATVDPAWIRENHRMFDLIVTHDRGLTDLPNVRILDFGGAWCPEPPAVKHLSVSFLYSTGRALPQFKGYEVRREIAKTVPQYDVPVKLYLSSRALTVKPEELDAILSGAEARKIGACLLNDSKDPLFNSMFHICVENSDDDYYFSEKIVDCFRSYTVPIYWGTRRVDEIFDKEGIIHFDKASDLDDILKSLTLADYWQRMPAMLRNYQTAAGYMDANENLRRVIVENLG